MRKFLHNFFSNPAWDNQGKFAWLLNREASPDACAIDGVPPEIVDAALHLFCHAFDIPDAQRFCLRPSDRVQDIYLAMVNGLHDDLEYERLAMNIDKLIARKVSQQKIQNFITVEDVIRFVFKNIGAGHATGK
ncbi:MAG TPA: hypothetical protein VH280_06565 [Verrucomicrobiae bacterium]|jgi:hypothetical protein|nr:hypothetical protein [Verrucomicrobiae bacterium]